MRFDLQRIAPQPWKNGAGLTREIAVACNATTEPGFDWRLSVAEVARDAPFSAFTGVDRCIVLLRGAGLLLRGGDGNDSTLEHRLDTRFKPFHFAGDVPLHATLLGGASNDFNVMVRRGAWRAEVTCHHAAALLPAAPVLMVLACAGEWQIGESPALMLRADQGLLWREPRAPAASLNVRPMQVGSEAGLLAVRLCHDHAP